MTETLLWLGCSAGGLGKFLGRKMLNGGDEGQADLGGNSNDIPLDLSTEATEPGAPTYFDAGSNEGRSSGGGGGAPTESVEEAGGKSAGSNPSGPSESEPAGSTAEPGQQEDEGGKSPHNAEGSGFVENGYAFLADAFNQGAIRIVPSRGGGKLRGGFGG